MNVSHSFSEHAIHISAADQALVLPQLFRYYVFLFFFGLGIGSGFQEHRNQNSKEHVAAEHEDQVDCIRYCDCLDSHYNPLYLQGVQLWGEVSISK